MEVHIENLEKRRKIRKEKTKKRDSGIEAPLTTKRVVFRIPRDTMARQTMKSTISKY